MSFSRGPNRRRFAVRSFDPSHLVQRESSVAAEPYVAKHAFGEWAIDGVLKQNIAGRGYSTPTPIQDQVIPLILAGRDVVGIANTGTGKTAAFLIPLINLVMNDPTRRVLVVVPTRELAIQIEGELRLLARNLAVYATLCIGGERIGKQIAGLRRRPNFVVGTPGRLRDLENQRQLGVEVFNVVVLGGEGRGGGNGFFFV